MSNPAEPETIKQVAAGLAVVILQPELSAHAVLTGNAGATSHRYSEGIER